MTSSNHTLESVTAEFNHWRATRASSNEATPVRLKTHTLELLPHYKKSQIIESLEINHSTLKKWRASTDQIPATFVSLPIDSGLSHESASLSLNEKNAPTLPNNANLKITLRNESGMEMCISGDLTPVQLLDLANTIIGVRGEST